MQRKYGFVVLFLGVCILWQASYLELGTLQRPGPAFFPMVVAFFIIILSLLAVVSGAKVEKQGDASRDRVALRVPIVYASLLSYFVLLDYLGFILITFLLMTFLFVVTDLRKWRTAAFKAVITTGLAYLLFEVLLSGNLPKGVLGL